ncbi:MAG: triose-phosphate isomerase [Candidatus Aenigmarchaeota archaeon]|nr:triose-phosphate isomerase [Candidatus Aenigmarchaeota archaeon]
MLYVINFKAYRNGTGKNAVKLAKIIKKVKDKKRKKIIVAVQPTDVPRVSKIITTFSQHVDPISYGAHTGWILPEAVKQAGAVGTLLNHSERKLSYEEIKRSVKRAREVKLKTIICCSDLDECKKLSRLKPDYIAIEPPELIGTGRSVSKEKPELIARCKKAIEVPLLCGAGITNGEDVKKARELGADGILVASAVIKSKNPGKALLDIIV